METKRENAYEWDPTSINHEYCNVTARFANTSIKTKVDGARSLETNSSTQVKNEKLISPTKIFCVILIILGTMAVIIFLLIQTLILSEENRQLIRAVGNRSDTLKILWNKTRIQAEQTELLQADINRGHKSLPEGWVSLFNGYQYKMTATNQSWSSNRDTCQSWGGDLAVFGVQSMKNRRKFFQIFASSRFWIGMKVTRRGWRWMNKKEPSTGSVLWAYNSPFNTYDVNLCANVRFDMLTYDALCSQTLKALCEKRVEIKSSGLYPDYKNRSGTTVQSTRN